MATTVMLTASDSRSPSGPSLGRSAGFLAGVFSRRAAWLWVAFVVARVCVWALLSGRGTDLDVQAGYGMAIRHGQVPFRDFDAEYPPLALAFDALPAVVDPSGAHYFAVFRSILCVADLAIFAALIGVHRIAPAVPCLFYLACSTALGPLLYDRLDLLLGGCLLAAVWAAEADRWGRAGVAVGVGAAFKVIPALWIPVVLSLAVRRRGGKAGFVAAAWMVGIPALTLLPVLPNGTAGLHRAYRYHADRGTQIESVPAAVQLLMIYCGTPGVTYADHGGASLQTPCSAPIVIASSVAVPLSAIACAGLAWRVPLPAAVLSTSLATSLCCAKVLSPQYLLALLPLLSAVPVAASVHLKPTGCCLWLACFGLTGIVFPFWYGSLVMLRPPAVWMLIARDELLVGVTALAIWSVWRLRNGHPPTRGEPSIANVEVSDS